MFTSDSIFSHKQQSNSPVEAAESQSIYFNNNCNQSRKDITKIFFPLILILIVISSSISFSQNLPVIKNELGDTMHYTWPLPDSVEYSKNEVIIKFQKNALFLHKLCYNYQGPPTFGDPEQDYANIFKGFMMTEEFPVDSLIADPSLKMAIHLFGGLYLTRITSANPCTDTLSITRYGDTVACDNYLWMTLKLNNDTSVVNACLALTIYFQHALDIAEPNYIGHLNRIPFDSYYATDPNQNLWQRSLWPTYTNTERAWDFQVGSENIRVGIIDTGIDWGHCDFDTRELNGNYKIAGGWNYVNPDEDIRIGSWHGTSVAGVIGAVTEGVGMGCPHPGGAGIAGGWKTENKLGCKLYGFKVDVSGETEIPVKGVLGAIFDAASDYDTEHESDIERSFAVHILNCSWGYEGKFTYLESLRNAFNFAFEQGVSIICSRGNTDHSSIWYPAIFEPSWITSVGSLKMDHQMAYDSRHGINMDLLAPGTTEIVSTTKAHTNLYANYGQTSISAPHVSGAIALLRSEFYENLRYRNIKAEPEDYQNIIKAAALDLNYDPDENEEFKTYVGYDNVSGWGELKIGNIFEMLNAGHNLYHEKITVLDEPEEFSGPTDTLRLITKKENSEIYSKKLYKAQKREITGSKTLTGFELPQLYVWGRSGLPQGTGKGGLSAANPLYESTKYTEVTSGQGGNGLVNGIYHNHSLTVTAKTYQYKLFDLVTEQFERYEPEWNDIELYFSVFGRKDPTSINDYKDMENSNFLYPNPASEHFILKFKTENICSPVIRIYNNLGLVVYKQNLEQITPNFHEITINIDNLTTGSYTIEINSGYSIQTQKLIVIK